MVGGMLASFPFISGNVTNLFWPSAGLAFASIWWFGRRAVAGILLGALMFYIFILSDTKVSHILPSSFAPALEALLAVWWLRRQGISDIFQDAESIFQFILVGVLLTPMFAATIGTATLHLNGMLLSTTPWQTWLAWWIGDSMGILLVAPFLLSLPHFREYIPSISKLIELLSVGILLVWLWFNLFMAPPALNLPPLSFTVIPLIIWVAVRFHIGVLASVLFIISLIAIHGTSVGYGPFVRNTLQESIAYLYGFLWTLSSIGLFLGVTVEHSRRSLDRLSKKRLALQVSEEGMRTTLESSPNVAVQWYDKDRQILYWNKASELLYGWSSEEALGKTPDQLMYTPEEAQRFTKCMDAVYLTGKMVGPVETVIRHRNGQVGSVLSTMFAMPKANGNPHRFVCMDVDITKLKQTEDALRTSNAHLTKAQSVAHLGSWEWDMVADQYSSSEEARHIFGIDSDSSRNFAVLQDKIHPDDREARLHAWNLASTYPNNKYDLEFRIIRSDGAVRYVHSQAEIAYDLSKQPIKATGTIHDITELKQAQAELERLAYYDELTGLPNYRLLRKRLAQDMSDALNENSYIALLFVDIDQFKILNDTHGHDAGDRLLRLVADRMQQSLDKEALLVRLGGDEFAIILPDLMGDVESARSSAMDIAERIRDILSMPFDFGDHVYHSSASIGAVLFPGEEAQSSLQDLLKQADTALYKAKDAGRNAICFFEAHMQAAVAERLAIEQDLRVAIGSEEIELYLQPQINEKNLIIGAECLLRWRHPHRGLISPAVFIPVAESTGLIITIGKWVLYQACTIISRLEAANKHIRISVNVSARQFRQHDFVSQVKECLEQTGAEPRRLVIEITESVVVDEITEVIARMTDLERLGVSFSIDDFGTGYSSLAYLKHLPLRELKIDKSFVDGLPRDLDDVAIVASILALARNLNLEVVAEGIETTDQLEYLKSHGCKVFQGYLLGRPVMSEELVAELLAR